MSERRTPDATRFIPSSRKLLEQRWRHARRKFLEQPHRPRHVAVAKMHQRQVLSPEAPLRHYFDEASLAQQLRLHNRWQVANAAAGKESGGQPGKIVYCQVRLEGYRFLAGLRNPHKIRRDTVAAISSVLLNSDRTQSTLRTILYQRCSDD